MTELLDQQFWSNLLNQVASGFLEIVPRLLLLLIIYWIVTRIYNGLAKRVQYLIKKKFEQTESTADDKRANTLFGIVNGTLKIVLSTIFVLIALEQVGINVGPILAGAGIVGVAVGFGSQELVRDVISGFFMLLENQIR